MKEAAEICNLIKLHKAHIFVCGDVQMAENVYQTLRWAYKTIRAKSEKKLWTENFLCRKIIAIAEKQSESVAEKYMLQLRVMHLARWKIYSEPNLNL